jgi:hypothetical protein
MDEGKEMNREVFKFSTVIFWMVCASFSALFAVGIAVFVISKDTDIPAPKKAASISGKVITLTDASKRDLIDTVNTERLIVATTVVTVDLIKNTRVPAFFYSEIPEMQTIWNAFAARGFKGIRVYDTKEIGFNRTITNIINGNLDCKEFRNTIAITLYPDAEKYAPWMCTISIPPGFDSSGDFVGLLALYLSREPSFQEKKYLAKISVDISRMIYNRDVLLQSEVTK